MESNDKKKRRERFLLDRFLERQAITPTRIDAGESPDFLITFDERMVGVEVTELFIQGCSSDARLIPEDHPLQAIESITALITSKAHEIYFEAKSPPVLSQIIFSNRITPVDKRKGDQIAKLISGQIRSMSRRDSEVADWRSRDDENKGNPLSEWVTFISTRRVPEVCFAEWSPISAGFVLPLTPERLQAEIHRKACKISIYKESVEEIWLLIVADRTRPSQKFSVRSDFPLAAISSPFSKTFYYGYASEDLLSFEAADL